MREVQPVHELGWVVDGGGDGVVGAMGWHPVLFLAPSGCCGRYNIDAERCQHMDGVATLTMLVMMSVAS